MRIAFRKEEAVKYISHLDLFRAWERIVRRARLPLAYSHGFNPHPKITIAMPLPVGCTGGREILDVILCEALTTEEIVTALEPAMPRGISVVAMEKVPLRSPALTTLFRQATYQISLHGIAEREVEQRTAHLMQRETVPVEFRRKEFDLRPLVGSLTLRRASQVNSALSPLQADIVCAHDHREERHAPYDEGSARARDTVVLEATLLQDSRGRIGRPDVLLEALGLSDHARHIHRAAIEFDQVPK